MRRYFPYVIVFAIISGSFVLTSNQGSGVNAATRLIKQVTDGAEKVIDTNGADIRISNVVLVTTSDGSAVLVGHIVNRGDSPDQLVGVATKTVNGVLSGEKLLRKDKPLFFEGENSNAHAVFTGLNATPGTFVEVALGFANAGVITVNALVQDQSGIYSDVSANAKSEATTTR